MPLLALWKSDPISVSEFTIEQVVAAAGNGELKDGSLCSQELHSFLSQVSEHKIAQYIEHCLSSGFSRSGMVLQDLVNELGRRLEYAVENGRYQGTTNAIGFDGIWTAPEDNSVIVEVKTTDAYRISLDTIVAYRERLRASGRVVGACSILIVVGRDDTGELEAQVRGSRHAWDVRLISAEALLKLVQLRVSADDPETGLKIRSLLTPLEYTRLDQLVDVMFAAASDVESTSLAQRPVEVISPPRAEAAIQAGVETASSQKGTWEFTDSATLQRKRLEIVEAMSAKLNTALTTRTRALYWSASHDLRVACSISKRYTKRGAYPYWYAYHPQWDEFLSEAREGYFVLGCADLAVAYSIPWSVLKPVLPLLNTTTIDRGTYWHVHLIEDETGERLLLLPKESRSLSLSPFEVQLKLGTSPSVQLSSP